MWQREQSGLSLPGFNLLRDLACLNSCFVESAYSLKECTKQKHNRHLMKIIRHNNLGHKFVINNTIHINLMLLIFFIL